MNKEMKIHFVDGKDAIFSTNLKKSVCVSDNQIEDFEYWFERDRDTVFVIKTKENGKYYINRLTIEFINVYNS